MLDQIQPFLTHPLTQSVITGLLGAAAADIAAFRTWQDWNDAAAYNWRTASWRWFQGAVIGLLAGVGLSAIA